MCVLVLKVRSYPLTRDAITDDGRACDVCAGPQGVELPSDSEHSYRMAEPVMCEGLLSDSGHSYR